MEERARILKMREKVTPERLRIFMREISRRTQGEGRVYFTGGSTALLLGLREQTIDVDIKVDPEPRGIFEAIADLKNELSLNVELASPDDFIPAPPAWQDLATPIERIGDISFFHYDLCMQALAKIERGFSQDLADARGLVEKKFVSIENLKKRFVQIEDRFIRYPVINPDEFKAKLGAFISSLSEEPHDQ
jgi:hypothetical protein